MDIKLILNSNGAGNKILIGGSDIADAVTEVSVEAFAYRAPEVTLKLTGKVEIQSDGSTVHMEYPHKVKKFFPGKQYNKALREKEE